MENNLGHSLVKKSEGEKTSFVHKIKCFSKMHHLFCSSIRTKIGVLHYLPLHENFILFVSCVTDFVYVCR